MKDNKLFMAFASGSESRDDVRTLYKGIAPVFVLAVNPNKAESEAIFNRELEEAPNYIGETEVGPEGNKVKVPQVRINFVIQTDVDKCGIDAKGNMSYFLAKSYKYNREGTKVEVINKYGESTWLPVEDVKANRVPENMKWFDTSGMRPAYIGEAALISFLKAYLNIPNKSFTRNGETKYIKNIADAEAGFDNIDNFFKGDFSELRTILGLQPKNKVKVCWGVKTNNDNRQYQVFYTDRVLKNVVSDYSKLDEEIQSRQSGGAYPSVEFSTEPLHEYVIESTNFDNPTDTPTASSSGLPWGANWNPNK